MNQTIDTIAGWTFETMGRVALSSWQTYRLLFAPVLSESVRERVSRSRAAAAFWRARRTVPAYRAFLDDNGGSERSYSRFEDIPIMDKDTYIRRHPLEATCRGGRLPRTGAVLDESSGSSGTATTWVRGNTERSATRRLIQYSARATFGEESFVLLNAFALGPWATGMNVSMSLVERCLLKSIGPDVGKIAATLEALGPSYKYIITGYPPFLKVLCDSAQIDWSAYEVCAVVGGEGMSEPLRRALNRCFRKTISSFGASDLEINMAVETDFTIAVRQAVAANPALGDDLFGSRESLPMVFQYDPLNYLLESDPDRNLLCTINRLSNVSPRIRYNIHDRGVVRTRSCVERVMKDHGVEPPITRPKVMLPLLFHWGRQEHAVAFYGCKVTPEDLQHAVLRIPELAEDTTELALHPFEDEAANRRLEIWIETRPGSTLRVSEVLQADLLRAFAEVNQDFRESIKMVPVDRAPTLRIYEHGASPMSQQDPRIKKSYIL
jgi:phenylacetate-CoA ligase